MRRRGTRRRRSDRSVVAAHGVDGDGEHVRGDRGRWRFSRRRRRRGRGTSRTNRTRCAAPWPTRNAGTGCEEACSDATRSPDGYASSTSMSSSSERPSFAFLVHVTADPAGSRSDRVRAAGSAHPCPKGRITLSAAARVHIRRRRRSSVDVDGRGGHSGRVDDASSAAHRGSRDLGAAVALLRRCGRCRTSGTGRHSRHGTAARRRVRAAPSRGRADSRSSWPSSMRNASGSITVFWYSSSTSTDVDARQRRETSAADARPTARRSCRVTVMPSFSASSDESQVDRRRRAPGGRPPTASRVDRELERRESRPAGAAARRRSA